MICGIDPGMTGAIALLYQNGFSEIHDMPVIGKGVDGREVAAILTEFRPDHIYIERVNAFGMGRTSAFNFGHGHGVLIGVMQTLDIPHTLVMPQAWKKHFGLSRNKDESRALATRLFPAIADQFKRKKDDGRAEAILIAKYGEYQK